MYVPAFYVVVLWEDGDSLINNLGGYSMVAIKLWDNKAIDTSSDKIKEDVSKSVTNYILNHWNECVKITNERTSDDKFETEFCISL